MKYFGEKSLSSVMSTILNISWYLSIIFCVVGPLMGAFIIFISTPAGESFMQSASKGCCHTAQQWGTTNEQCSKDLFKDYSEKDRKDWAMFKSLPLAVKLLILPYFGGIMVLLLLIIKRSRLLFANFKKDLVFNKNNVQLIATISKLLIAFSIVTFTFSTLLVSIVLFLLCEIIKNGAELKEELDLTI